MPSLASANDELLRRSTGVSPQELARFAALLLWGSLWFVALFLAARRVSGALATPLAPSALFATGAILAAIAAMGHFAWQRGAAVRSQRECAADVERGRLDDRAKASRVAALDSQVARAAARWAPAAALFVVGLCLWLPGVSSLAMASFWTLVIAEEAWAGNERRIAGARGSGVASSVAIAPAPRAEPELRDTMPFTTDIAEEPHAPSEAESETALSPAGSPLAGPHFLPARPLPPLPPGKRDLAHAEPMAPHFDLPPHDQGAEPLARERYEPEQHEQLIQQLTRLTTAAGADRLQATLYAQLPIGGRTTSVHVAFCPPFASLPHVEYEQANGPAARIKLAQLLVHGARFDIKLQAAAAESETVCIEMTAEHKPLADEAAPRGVH
jgi:hypothetical protein